MSKPQKPKFYTHWNGTWVVNYTTEQLTQVAQKLVSCRGQYEPVVLVADEIFDHTAIGGLGAICAVLRVIDGVVAAAMGRAPSHWTEEMRAAVREVIKPETVAGWVVRGQ